MKKFLTLVVCILASLSLVACNKETTVVSTTVAPTTESTADPLLGLLNAGDEVSISFWHIFGQTKEAALKSQIAEFANMMKDKYDVTVNVTATTQSNYDSLLDKTNKAIAAGDPKNMPNIVIGYPDHFAGYLKSKVLVSLEPYINSATYGIDTTDYIQGYMDENNQFGGITYSLPFSKSGECMVYNKKLTDELGITIPYDRALTWNEIIAMKDKLLGYKGTSGLADIQYLVNYDSTSNLFINFSRQLNAKYTTTAGELLVKDQSTVTMVTLIENYIKNKYLSVPINYDATASYGSAYFQQQKMAFTIGSTAGASYNVPNKVDASTGVQELFECGVAWVPQFTIDVNGGTASNSVVQQGPNICILNAGTAEENLVAWLLIKYMTYQSQYAGVGAEGADADGFVVGQNNSARFALATGYFPVTNSAYNSAVYQNYMAIAKKYYTELGGDKSKLSAAEQGKLVFSEVAYLGYLQNAYYKYDPAFAATSKLLGSAAIRQAAGSLINKIAKDTTYDATKALQEMYDSCILG